VAGIYGAVFGLGFRLVRRLARGPVRRAAVGAVYGLGLYTVAASVLLPAWGSFLLAVPAAHFMIAHLLYGVTLGLLVGRGHGHQSST
jgi:hypothetical protein